MNMAVPVNFFHRDKAVGAAFLALSVAPEDVVDTVACTGPPPDGFLLTTATTGAAAGVADVVVVVVPLVVGIGGDVVLVIDAIAVVDEAVGWL